MSYNTNEPTSSDDIIDVRDLIEYFKELRDETEALRERAHGGNEDGLSADDFEEIEKFKKFETLMDELSGNGGDEQFEGNWYPLTLIRESHFEDYAQELAEDTGAIDRDLKWPYTCIDWSQAAEELKQDYTSCEFEGVTYYYR